MMRLPTILVTNEQNIKRFSKKAYDVFSSVSSSRLGQKDREHISEGILSITTDITKMVEILKTRSRTEIIGLILQAVEEEPLIRPKIMYRAMLNFKQATDYTAILVQEGFLRYLMLDRKYAITDKGRQFLALSSEINKLLTAPNDHDDNMAAGNLQVQNQQ